MISQGGNGTNGRGALGGGTPTKPTPGRRSALQVLRRHLKHNRLLDHEIAESVRFAVQVREDEEATYRDRMRATELLNSMMKMGIDVAMYLDKNDRIDDGGVTERHEFLTVEFDERG